MEVQPAHISQVQVGLDGKLYEIDADASTVAADLAALDAGLKVRFSERGECFIVQHEHHPGCPHNGEGGPGSSYLVSTAKAYRGRTGVWTGLDQRIVDRIKFIDPKGRSGYDFAREIELNRIKADKRERERRMEHWTPIAEGMAHALRKDLGERYRGRAFITTPLRKEKHEHR